MSVSELSKVSGKEYSPLVVRKYTFLKGVPMFVALITDDDVSDLDKFVRDVVLSEVGDRDYVGLQDFRRVAGKLTDELSKHYPRAEGIAVIVFPDKAAVSSLWGDFMNHLHCRMELYMLINTMWHL